jgi:hypothetical protein
MPKLRDAELRLRVRERVEDARLPVMVPKQIAASCGSGHVCVVCDHPIKSDQVEYEFDDYRDGKRLCFHLGCHAVWQIECARRA